MYNSQLATFVCVADCGSFNQAAEKLFISSTAVMKQINSLEEHLNLKLLERTNHGTRLTAAGKAIYKDAKFLMDYSKKALEHARLLMDTVENTLCVGTSILNPCKEFMDLWYQVNDDFPGCKLHIVPFEDDHENILNEIAALGEKFDFVIAVCDSTEWLNRCSFYKLGEHKLCCALPHSHRLAKKVKLAIEDLYGERLLMVKRGDSPSNDTVRDELEQNHPQIIIKDTAHFYDISVFNDCERTGSILLTFDIWADVHPALVTIPVDWEYSVPYGLLYALEPPEDVLAVVEAIKTVKP